MRNLALLFILAAAVGAEEPRFAGEQMLRPQSYREWVFVGSSLGMSYNEDGAAKKQQNYHVVFLEPGAWKHYQKTGTFPEKTMLMMEVYSAGQKESINRAGSFADDFLRVEAAVKDSARFDGGWAYFDFGGPAAGGLKERSTAFAKDRCWSCHNEHGGTDNVFTQFYPVLNRKP